MDFGFELAQGVPIHRFYVVIGPMQAQALSVTVAWLRLERAHADYARQLRRDHGITPLQLAILSILTERPSLPLAALRKALAIHAATIGQSIDELRRMGLCLVRPVPEDRRARMVSITEAGRERLEQAPKAGPVRLRSASIDPARLDRLRDGLGDAIDLFGLEPWIPDQSSGR